MYIVCKQIIHGEKKKVNVCASDVDPTNQKFVNNELFIRFYATQVGLFGIITKTPFPQKSMGTHKKFRNKIDSLEQSNEFGMIVRYNDDRFPTTYYK